MEEGEKSIMGKIKIVKKNDEFNSEYGIGDVFEVEGTWYGGVHIKGKTGIPVSLDKEEYIELKEETAVSDSSKELTDGTSENQERLKAFEKMLQAVQTEYGDILQKMASLKANGRAKSVTYQQLLGRKMMYQNMLSMYELYGLLEERSETDCKR